jgi:aminoglycoside phosphotransferase
MSFNRISVEEGKVRDGSSLLSAPDTFSRMNELRLDSRLMIGELTRPPQGIRHRLLFGTEQRSGREVAAKIELIDGALERERRALEWLTEAGGPAPRLIGAGRVLGGEHAGALCLVTERITGGPATTLAAWERLGQAIAWLAEASPPRSELPALDHGAFLGLYRDWVETLAAATGRDLAAELPAVPSTYSTAPLVLTHGDPGPGNFVDDDSAGTLIDWEDAAVGPLGLDLGRATFIALLGAGPEGFVATEREARAAAARDGFLAAVGRSPGEEERSWWLAVAGVQFAYWRLRREGRPGVPPWREALAVLDAVLAHDSLHGTSM